MELSEAVEKRRSYRALDPIEITDEIIRKIVETAQLAPSCFNNQPWNYVLVRNKEQLEKMHDALSSSNDWAKKGSMIIAVFSKKELDCVVGSRREYYLFDTGMATAFMMLQATELGLVIHPIAGFSERKTREILGIPEEMTVITLLIVGKHSNDLSSLTEGQLKSEENRPARKKQSEFSYIDYYQSSD